MLARGTGIMTMDPIQRGNDYKDGKRKGILYLTYVVTITITIFFFSFFFYISSDMVNRR